jgi:hypothetical protein
MWCITHQNELVNLDHFQAIRLIDVDNAPIRLVAEGTYERLTLWEGKCPASRPTDRGVAKYFLKRITGKLAPRVSMSTE